MSSLPSQKAWQGLLRRAVGFAPVAWLGPIVEAILTKVECLIIDDFACMNIHDADLLDSLYVLLRTRIDDHLSPKTKKKIRATFVTTHHHLEDWPHHLIGDDFKVLQIINILYGRGTLLSIDEKAPRIEEDETTSSASEATR
jgi:hypothetical protein